MKGTKKMIKIDLWYKDRFKKKKYSADAYFAYGLYSGNIYNDDGKMIGDYISDDSLEIEENFNIKWED